MLQRKNTMTKVCSVMKFVNEHSSRFGQINHDSVVDALCSAQRRVSISVSRLCCCSVCRWTAVQVFVLGCATPCLTLVARAVMHNSRSSTNGLQSFALPPSQVLRSITTAAREDGSFICWLLIILTAVCSSRGWLTVNSILKKGTTGICCAGLASEAA